MSAEVKALIERFDHMRNSGVCSPTTRGLLDDAETLLTALYSPPADDVREAVMNALACHRRKVTVPAFNRPVCSCGWASTTVDYGAYAFDGHIADAVAAEVRPYGTVTDTEEVWEYRADFNDGMTRYTRDEEQARQWLSRAVRIKRHRPMVPAGEWETYTGEARS